MKPYLYILVTSFFIFFINSTIYAQTVIKTDISNSTINNDSSFTHKPTYIDTGNEDNDKKNYQSEKENWIKNYPQEYNAWVKSNSVTKHNISAKEFKTMPKEKQDNILNNPDKYFIIENE